MDSPLQEQGHARGMTGRSISKMRLLLVLALLALTVASWLPRFRGPLDLRWDAGSYYVLGTSLAEGRGYRLLNEPGQIEAIQYPPLLPCIVAVHQWILGTSDPILVGRWLRLSFFLMFTIYILSAYTLLERFLPAGWACVSVVMCLLHLFAMFLSDVLFAELPFALASVLFMLCHGKNGSRIYPVLSGACAILTYLLRTAGIALLIAWVGESLLKRDFKRAALRFAVALLPVLGWQSYIAHVQASAVYTLPSYPYQRADYLFYNVSYVTNLSLRDPLRPELGKVSLRDVGKRIVHNTLRIPQSLGEAVSTDRAYWQGLVLGRLPGARHVPDRIGYTCVTVFLAFLGALTLGGVVVQMARRQWVVALYIMAYIGAVCLTPWPLQWRRYWSPLAPFLVLALLQCLLTLRDCLQRAVPLPTRVVVAFFPAAVVGLILVVESLTVLEAYKTTRGEAVLHDRQGHPVHVELFFYGQPNRALDEALAWLRVHAQPTDAVATAMPHWAYLVTHMTTVMPPFESDPEKAQALLDAVPVRYIVMDSTDVDVSHLMRRRTWPVLRGVPSRWTEVYADPAGLVAIYERAQRESM